MRAQFADATTAAERAEWARRGGSCEWLLHDMCALPAHWGGTFDAVVDKGGLCAAIFAGEAHAAAACREAARCSAPHASMHYITDDAPELRVDLLRAVLPGYTTLTLTLTRLPKCGPATRWCAYPHPYPYPYP